MREATCRWCGSEFVSDVQQQRMCSDECRRSAATSSSTPIYIRECELCDRTFVTKDRRPRFCSARCRQTRRTSLLKWRECEVCGDWVVNRAKRSPYRCRPCSATTANARTKRRQCVVCSVWFDAHRAKAAMRRKYGDQFIRTCSRECGVESRDRECVVCGAPSGKRERCDIHWAAARVQCPALAPCECAWCGRLIVNWRNADHSEALRQPRRSKYCSTQCEQYSHLRRPKVVEIDYRECRECGSTFSWYADQEKDFCGAKCSRRAHKRDRRHLERTAGVGARGSITLREVAERDGWQCHLCHRIVPDRESKSRPNDPTIDHLIPLSDGGQHVPENVALAHFKCNWQRAATGPAQLRLIA